MVETAEMQELQMAMQAALDAFLYDHPEVFWVKGYSAGYYMSISGDVGTISRIAITLTEIYEGASSGISAYDTAVANTVKTVLTPLTSQQKVTCSSANKKIATVSNSRKVAAKKKGTVKITVKSGSKLDG